MSDCIFCKIVAGEIPSAKLIETDNVLSFLDIAPANKGHALVVPKAHHETLTDIPDELLKELAVILKQLTPAVLKAVSATDFNIEMSNGKAANQVVPHAHIHIIPRFPDDGQMLGKWKQGSYGEGEAQALQEQIKSLL